MATPRVLIGAMLRLWKLQFVKHLAACCGSLLPIPQSYDALAAIVIDELDAGGFEGGLQRVYSPLF